MSDLNYGEINDIVLSATRPPRPAYYVILALLAAAIGWAALVWIYQMHTGMGVAGISHPVNWGVYIANFVFWVGIAHSGTLISAILHLVRARWRDAVSRAAEAMTVFAVMTAGLFPLIHLGRVWVFHYILPYPSQRQIWPNFQSPLVWDVVAVSTYFTVSLIFWYVGMVPDLAAARDRAEAELGPHHLRSRFYRTLAMGWYNAGSQWRHYDRSYLFFAALATPLVISVHSVVSWDFAMSILPGWHTTLFAPYFVAGAIHSGLAMVLTLIIPMRKLLNLERLVTIRHLENVAKTIVVTATIVGYSYAVEGFIAWYSGNIFEQQFFSWRMTSGGVALIYWVLFPLNVLIPLTFVFRKVRTNLKLLLTISVLLNVGMWLERVLIVTASTSHDFLPHNWGSYFPRWTEASITIGSFSFFLFWFFGFSKLLPTVPMTDVKEQLAERELKGMEKLGKVTARGSETAPISVVAVFTSAADLVQGVRRSCEGGFSPVETYSPVKLGIVDDIVGRKKSPIRYWVLAGALIGVTTGFSLAIGTALVNSLIVGGKPPVAIIPYCILGFEFTVLVGALANLAGLLFHTRLHRRAPRLGYRTSFSRDRFGLVVQCGKADLERVRNLLAPSAEETYVFG